MVMSSPDITVHGNPYQASFANNYAGDRLNGTFVKADQSYCSVCCNLSPGTAFHLLPRSDIDLNLNGLSGLENVIDAKANGSYDYDEAVPLWAGTSRIDWTSFTCTASLKDMIESAEKGCPSCAIVSIGIMKQMKWEHSEEAVNKEVDISFCRGDVLRIHLHDVVMEEVADEDDFHLCGFLEMPASRELIAGFEFYTLPGQQCPWPTIGSSTKFETQSRQGETWEGGPTRHVIGNPTIAEVVKLVREWLDDCTCSHPACGDSNLSAIRILPKRVLDVGKEDNTDVHVFEPGDQSIEKIAPYVALSHCWGLSQHLISTKDTIDTWKRNIPSESLPKTFLEAIDVTRALGIQYIWIDSLCIIQDDLADWEIEAAKMGSIYNNALLVIAATASMDGDGGILFPKPSHNRIVGMDQNQLPFEIYIRHMISHIPFTWGPGADENLHSRYNQTAVVRKYPGYPLFTRAWCFQERLLGTKVLHFTEREIVFECLTTINCECGSMTNFSERWLLPLRRQVASHGMNSGNSYIRLPPKLGVPVLARNLYQSLKSLPEGPSVEDTLLNWRGLVSEYSEKSITRYSDWLPALAGLASKWFCSDTGRYLAGIWTDDLPRSLLWQALGSDQNKDTNKGYIAPSWSWASVGCPISWMAEASSTSTYHVEFDTEKSDINLRTQDTFGAVTGGWIYLSGLVAEVSLQRLRKLEQGQIGLLQAHEEIQRFHVDNYQQCSSLVGSKVLWLKYCNDGGHERALVLAQASNDQLIGLPQEVQNFPLVCQRVGIVEYADKRITLPERRKVSMYLI